jgi:protein-S-isoprenylcysteine O-methyltransferase Ste14
MHSHVARPFKVPFGYFGVGLVCVVGCSVCIFNLVVSSWEAQVAGAVLVVSGIAIYWLCKRFIPSSGTKTVQ